MESYTLGKPIRQDVVIHILASPSRNVMKSGNCVLDRLEASVCRPKFENWDLINY